MDAKLMLYLFSTVIVVFSIDSVNINAIFKKNKVFQARVFYFLLALCMIEILTELFYNLFTISKLF